MGVSSFFEEKVQRVIEKNLDNNFQLNVKPELSFGVPDFAISFNGNFFLLIDACRKQGNRNRIFVSGGRKDKQMVEYANNFISILVINSILRGTRISSNVKRPYGTPYYYIMSVTVLGKFLKFLSTNLKSSLAFFASTNLPAEQIDNILDKFIDSLTPKENKCPICENRLLHYPLYFCRDNNLFITEEFAEETEVRQVGNKVMYGKTHIECEGCGVHDFDNCNYTKCPMSGKVSGRICRACFAIFNDYNKLIKIDNFVDTQREQIMESIPFYCKNKLIPPNLLIF